MRKDVMFLAAVAITLVALAWAPRVGAYTGYNNDGGGCVQCHPGFEDGFSGPLHQQHVGPITNTCLLCHTESRDDPRTDDSGDGVGCIGCHEPSGLRLHHANAGAPADGFGLFCANCHPSDPPPPAEDVVDANTRPYYLRSDVTVKDPCQAMPAPPGEDFDDDLTGLDNDGDLAYDAADPDCAAAPTASPTATITATPTATEPATMTLTPAVTATATSTPSGATPTATGDVTGTPTVVADCVGDCGGDRLVTVDELVKGVNIALGSALVDECPEFDKNLDGRVTVDELVTAVNNALSGCP